MAPRSRRAPKTSLRLLLASGCSVVGWAWPWSAKDRREGSVDWEKRLDHGSFRGFPSYDEAVELLEGWLRTAPGILRKERIGSSYLKRPIYAYILSATPRNGARASRPQVLATALMHAREPASLTVVLYFIGRALELYRARDAETVYVLENREIWLVPFVNPDGYIANQKSSRPIIRKNLRPTCQNVLQGGVDLNRNFAIAWRKDAFPHCNEEYGGTAPFSEPETQALRSLCDQQKFTAAINFHSFGSMLTHPLNFASTPAKARLPKADDNLVYREIAQVFKFKKFGPAISTVGYTAIGESDDWFYTEKGIISMSPEVGPESGDFFPPPKEIPGIDHRNFARTMYLVKKAGLELGVSWKHFHHAKEGVLELSLVNSGLTASLGSSLSIAVAGAGRAARADLLKGGANSSLFVISSDSGRNLSARILPLGSGSSGSAEAVPAVVVFEIPPLPRRSKGNVLRLHLAGSAWRREGARKLHLCVLEAAKEDEERPASESPVCHCAGAADLPPLGFQGTMSATPQQSSLVLSGAKDGGTSAEVCSAAARRGRPEPIPLPTPQPAGAAAVPSPLVTAAEQQQGAARSADRDSAHAEVAREREPEPSGGAARPPKLRPAASVAPIQPPSVPGPAKLAPSEPRIQSRGSSKPLKRSGGNAVLNSLAVFASAVLASLAMCFGMRFMWKRCHVAVAPASTPEESVPGLQDVGSPTNSEEAPVLEPRIVGVQKAAGDFI